MPTPLEKYELYLLNNVTGERIVEIISISHSAFEEEHHLCREPGGISVIFETGEKICCRGVNMMIKRSSSKDDTDEKFEITIADEESIVQDEADKIPIDSSERIKVTYRAFVFSDLTAPALQPVRLDGVNISFDNTASTLVAESPSMTETRTGTLYTYERFEMLRAFLL